MHKKTILITGCTNGIGKELTYFLNQETYHILLIGRNKKLLTALKNELLEKNPNNQVDDYICDFTDLKEVEKTVSKIKEEHQIIDIIVHNAGALASKKGVVTNDKIPFTLAVNYYAPKIITEGLIENLLKSENPVIFHTTSLTVKNIHINDLEKINTYRRIKAYGTSKTCFYLYLEKLFYENNQLNVIMFDPRIVYTNAVKNMMPKGLKWLSFLSKIIARPATKVAYKANRVLKENENGFNHYKLEKKKAFELNLSNEHKTQIIQKLEEVKYL
ncbi:Short-chain dehydrogenase/reductase SDR [Alteracholeplasma palmae J233]|uniref:Short-chain dehydrogenase/reductase SDR n=1 Tax=Alteracholeplasma palmae (strain ATCC 49389 / J233) TaxID=1318466 RepID=U4KKQ6_ALTPJ|nr:SDR family NAD(P)-dependent oxidoreductase [Alteracholeplasma palmae]CCV64364.1 Short-chain dehydrogenase/reductase SDR [Alteracholeplasma palmae J233]